MNKFKIMKSYVEGCVSGQTECMRLKLETGIYDVAPDEILADERVLAAYELVLNQIKKIDNQERI